MQISLQFFLFLFGGSFLFSLLYNRWWIKVARKLNVTSQFTARDAHHQITPTMGGISFAVPFMLFLIYFAFSGSLSNIDILMLIISLGTILFLGALDDIYGLSPVIKLLGQLLSIIILIIAGIYIDTLLFPVGPTVYIFYFGLLFTVIILLLIINAFNFIDGLDGLAGGISLIILSTLTYIAYTENNIFIVAGNITVISALSGFLYFNRHPAKLFMGDIGSLFLGSLIGFETLFVFSHGSNNLEIFPAVILLGIPLADVLLAFFRRLHAGLSPFLADKKHIHHRLIEMGFSYRETVYSIFVLTVISSIFSLLTYYYHNSLSILLLIGFLSAIIILIVRMGYFNLFNQTIIIYPHASNFPYEEEVPMPVNIQRLWHKILILLSDIVFINLSLFLTYSWKISGFTGTALSVRIELSVFIFLTVAWIFLFFLNNMYDMPWDISLFFKLRKAVRVIWFGILMIGIFTFDIKTGLTTSQIKTLLFYGIVMTILINLGRLTINFLEKKYRIFEYKPKKTIIIGSDSHAANIIDDCRTNPEMLYDIAGIVQKNTKNKTFKGIKILGTYEDIPWIISKFKIEEIIIAGKNKSEKDINEIIAYCAQNNVIIKISPEIKDIFSLYHLEELSGHELLKIFKTPVFYWQKFIKRILDIIIAASALVILSPVALYILSGKKRKKILKKRKMLGLRGKPFYLYELSFYEESEKERIKNILPAVIKRFPSFWLILAGKMSLVGPRPEPIEWYEENRLKIPFIYQRLLIKPGVTGLNQVKYRYLESQKDPLERIKYDLYYFQNQKISLDLRIILQSIFLVYSEIVNMFKKEK